jgi:chromosome segregation ATPase
VPKNEREWWASREIEKLERELTETERLRFGADADRRRLRCDLSAAKAEASHYMAVAQKATDELIFFRADSLKAHQMTCAAGLERDSLRAELARLRALFPEILAALRNGAGCTADVSVGFLESVPNEVASVVSRLRAEVERWKTVAAEMSQEREHNANEASRLRADVERLTAKIGNQADRIRYLEGATNHATGTPLSQAIARAEKAEDIIRSLCRISNIPIGSDAATNPAMKGTT